MDVSQDNTKIHSSYALEQAARYIEKCLLKDSSAPTLYDMLNISQNSPTVSGLTDHDYPNMTGYSVTTNSIHQMRLFNKVPLPPEVLEHFNHIQCHCMMGLFTKINRAWLTIDSDIYLWTYEDGGDVAYFDGLNETIVSVGLVTPKPGVFHNYIQYLLILSTAVDIVVLGVVFTEGPNGPFSEIQLIPDAVFTLPTDGSTITTVAGSNSGRIFLGSKDGSLFEIAYQGESSWFGKRCKKVNHSVSSLSFLVPSFLNAALTEEDGIAQISIDNSRHILYTMSEKGTIEVYDMGEKGQSMSRIARVSQSTLVQQAINTVKTLDSQNFRPIVSISAVEASDSLYINLVAVTQTGVRFYLTTVSLSNLLPNQRPYTLTLVHVRLPPGYSANMTTRPRMVHMANYSEQNLIMLSTVNDKESLWCISSDLFPFNPMLMEAYTTLTLDGPALAVDEVQYTTIEKYVNQPKPPLVVRQHSVSPKKYVVLTAQGAHIFLKLRPVDVLKHILQESHGLDSEAIKMYFRIQSEEQACAASLILACLNNPQNQEIAEYAAKAFFMLGGEPRLIPQIYHQQDMLSNTTMFQPNLVSTPMPMRNPQVSLQNATFTLPNQTFVTANLARSPNVSGQTGLDVTSFVFSPKHEGLYLYLGRILRPIWNLCCLEKVTSNDKKVFYTSSITNENCTWILNLLTSLKTFLASNTQLSVCNSVTSHTQTSQNVTVQNTRPNFTVHDAQLQERHSLDSLKTFTTHACEVIGLWRILCEHQIHVLFECLSEAHKQMLQNTTFKDLILTGHELCSVLITSLINSYLNDNACVDSISSKLRDVCPYLYKTEDEAYSKANEILKKAKLQQNFDERNELVVTALDICKTVAPHLNLQDICQQFVALKAYYAVVELCICCAKKRDPEHFGEHFFQTGERSDQDTYKYYIERMDIYNEVLAMLETIYVSDENNPSNTFNGTLGNVPVSTYADSNFITKQVINNILEQDDDLLHIAVFEWMMAKKMIGDLIAISSPTLEAFLLKTSERSPDNITILDLLWKYYESNNNHASAAKVLNNLASTTGNGLNLKERLNYLARAIMCMRSDKTGYAPYLGVFLRELEDKIDIAKVQELILDAVCTLRGSHPNADEAIRALNGGLYEITQLYEEFADAFNLWECKLAIIDCAGYSDMNLVKFIWRNILQEAVNESSASGVDKMLQIFAKIKPLCRKYKNSANCFPLDYIIQELEVINCKLKADKSLIPDLFVSIDVPIENLLHIYNELLAISLADRFWSQEENELHLSEVIANIISIFINTQQKFNNIEKRRVIALCQDTVAGLLSNLYTKTNAESLIGVLRGLESKLKRL